MKITSLMSVALLALPVLAQDQTGVKVTTQDASVTADQAENVFFKAFYLERGPGRRSAEAIELYKKFLDTAPGNKYAGDAAKNTINLLNRGGKPEDVEAFKTKYAAIVKNLDLSQPADAPADQPGQRGAGRGQGGQGGQGGRGGQAQQHIDDLKAQLEKAKTDKDEAKIKDLTAQIKTAEDAQAARRQGGQGGQGGRGMRGAMNKPITEMTDEELGGFEQALPFFDRRISTLRDSGKGEDADKATALVKKMKDAITAGKKEEAEAARLELNKVLPPMQRRGGGGGL